MTIEEFNDKAALLLGFKGKVERLEVALNAHTGDMRALVQIVVSPRKQKRLKALCLQQAKEVLQ